VKIGLPREYFIDGIDPQVDAAVRGALRHYEGLGAEIVEVSLPYTEHAVGVYYIIATAEASANLARFDGIRYGHRAEDARRLDRALRTHASGGFRAGGEAPHHSRNLRLKQRLL
jgi:aspartyl-tRNA(Asn)/glutamyl-tRNA(Gln) amidotransferase subunit A